jgi:hypothetical protein
MSSFWGDIGKGLKTAGTFAADALSGGAISKTKAARENNRAQQRAMLAAGQISQDQYNKNIALLDQAYNQAETTQQPYLDVGQRALGRQEALVDEYGQQQPGYVDTMGARPESYTPGEFKFSITPEMQQKIDASTNAVQSSAAAKGLLGSSGALRSIQQGAADITQQGVDNQFNQFMQKEGLNKAASDTNQNIYTTDRGFNYGKYGDDVNRSVDALTRKYNALSGLSGMGQQAAGNMSNLAVGRGTALAGEGSNLAEIQANLAMGRSNATAAKNNAVASAQGSAGTNIINNGLKIASTFGAL